MAENTCYYDDKEYSVGSIVDQGGELMECVESSVPGHPPRWEVPRGQGAADLPNSWSRNRPR
jgi:hypothetical protein